MKTKLITLGNWNDILKSLDWSGYPSDEQIEKTILLELTKGKVAFAEQSPRERIQKGCRVTLKTQSELPKYNKEKTMVTVGSGLYNREIEALVCTMKVGETGKVCVQDKEVIFTILKAEKKVYPELTDELVQALGMEEIRTLADYRSMMEQKLKKEAIAHILPDFIDGVAAVSEIEKIQPVDVEKTIDREYDALNFRFHLDELSDEKWDEAFGSTKLQEFYLQIYPDVASIFGSHNKASFYQNRQAHAYQEVRDCLVLNAVLEIQKDPTVKFHAGDELKKRMINKILALKSKENIES